MFSGRCTAPFASQRVQVRNPLPAKMTEQVGCPQLAAGNNILPRMSLACCLRKGGQRFSSRSTCVTGYGQSRDRKRAADAGFDEHLTKPVEMSALEMILGKVARTQRAPH